MFVYLIGTFKIIEQKKFALEFNIENERGRKHDYFAKKNFEVHENKSNFLKFSMSFQQHSDNKGTAILWNISFLD